MLQTETIHPSALTPELIGAWRALCAAEPAYASPLLGPDFALAVGAVREDARVTIAYRACRPALFWPHHRRPDGLARPIGAPFSDYHAVVADAAVPFSPTALLEAAGVRRFVFDGLIDPRGRFEAVTAARQPVYGVRLSAGPEAYFESLRASNPKRFKNMRRLEHKLDREVGELELVAPDRDPEAFARLMAWKSDQFARTGLHDVTSPLWVKALMRNLFAAESAPMQGMLLMLRAGGRPVAGHFGVRSGTTFHPWIAAFDPEFQAYGPGVTLISCAIRAMERLGLTTYDLSGGHDHYKRPFVVGSEMVAQGVATPDGRAPSPLRFAERPPALVRLSRRIDHIAAVETTLTGRVKGLVTALRGATLRLADAGAGSAE
jgi:CelD/BcsL family acetyltransferase involved in cellulose biosynthesis